MRRTIARIVLCSLIASPVLAAPDDGTLPKIDFPAVDTSAKKGEWVLSVNKLMYDRFAANPEKEGVIFYAYELIEPGPKTSKFKAISAENSAPNSLVISIPKGGKAKVGDIVLTWWQSGSGMQRAIVVGAKDPKSPVVRYLDLDYDNPAKSSDGKTTIGQMEEQLKPDTFVIADKAFAPGTNVACTAGEKKWDSARVVRVAGDKILVSGFAGKLSAKPKADCTALPQKPKVKAKDKVMAVWVGQMKPAVVSKVDAKIGRIWVKYENMGDKETAVAYGHVIAKL